MGLNILLMGAFTVGVLLLGQGLEDFVALDLGIYHDLLLFNQSILMRQVDRS